MVKPIVADVNVVTFDFDAPNPTTSRMGALPPLLPSAWQKSANRRAQSAKVDNERQLQSDFAGDPVSCRTGSNAHRILNFYNANS